MDCRRYTSLIVQKDGSYLVGCILGTKLLKWSDSPYDAWMTREVDSAVRVSVFVGGSIMLFNPVVGQIREFRGG